LGQIKRNAGEVNLKAQKGNQIVVEEAEIVLEFAGAEEKVEGGT
jgi:hypothetical protein